MNVLKENTVSEYFLDSRNSAKKNTKKTEKRNNLH